MSPSQLKILLKEQNGIQVLTVMSPISSEDFKIVRAGLIKLLRDGKNRIDVHFESTEAVELSVINELKALNAPARELAGEIVVSATHDLCRKSLMAHVDPKELTVCESVEQAIQQLNRKPAQSEESQLIQKLKEQVLSQERGEMGKLRAENERLRAENERLVEAVEKMMIDRATAFDSQGFAEQISVLEKKIEALVAEQEAAKPAPAAT